MRLLSFIIIFSISLSVSGVRDSLGFFENRNVFVSVQASKGFLVAHRTSLSAITEDYTSSFMIEVGTKTIGRKAWQSVYNNPSLGLGYFRSTLSNDEVLGKANAIYGFIEVPYFRERKVSLTYQFDGGLAYISKRFDLYDNIYNVAIGSHLNVFVRLSYDVKLNLFRDKFFFKTGFAFTHMSNGKTQTPNLGLNTLDWHFTLAYNLTPRKKPLLPIALECKKHTFMGILAGGAKEQSSSGLGKYFAGNVTLEYEYAVWNKSAWGVGFDLFYDGVMQHRLNQLEDAKPFLHSNRFGAHISYVHYYGSIGYITQLGYYINPYFNEDLPYYFRIGLRAKVSKHLLLNLTMKTHLARADIVEFGLGYYFSR